MMGRLLKVIESLLYYSGIALCLHWCSTVCQELLLELIYIAVNIWDLRCKGNNVINDGIATAFDWFIGSPNLRFLVLPEAVVPKQLMLYTTGSEKPSFGVRVHLSPSSGESPKIHNGASQAFWPNIMAFRISAQSYPPHPPLWFLLLLLIWQAWAVSEISQIRH